jgi:hypothetical protein
LGPRVHGLLFCERVRDELGVTPPDQGIGGGAGPRQIATGRSLDQRLHPDGKGTGELRVMILDGLNGLGICGACCDNDHAHGTPPAQTR